MGGHARSLVPMARACARGRNENNTLFMLSPVVSTHSVTRPFFHCHRHHHYHYRQAMRRKQSHAHQRFTRAPRSGTPVILYTSRHVMCAVQQTVKCGPHPGNPLARNISDVLEHACR